MTSLARTGKATAATGTPTTKYNSGCNKIPAHDLQHAYEAAQILMVRAEHPPDLACVVTGQERHKHSTVSRASATCIGL
jgi:hypothetical protein